MRNPDGKSPKFAAVADLLTNVILISALMSFLVAQLIKTCTHRYLTKRWDVTMMARSGGMPSSHTACVCGLATSVALSNGVTGALFPICAVLALIVAYDAHNVRRFVGQQAAVLNAMLLELPSDHAAHLLVRNGDQLKTTVGHTLQEVLCGALTGAVVAVLVNLLWL